MWGLTRAQTFTPRSQYIRGSHQIMIFRCNVLTYYTRSANEKAIAE